MGSVRKLIDDDRIDDALVIDVNGVRLKVAVRVGSSARTPLLLANGIGASLETQAARRLGVAKQTVLDRIRRGELNAVHVNRGQRKGLAIQLPLTEDTLFTTAP